MRKIIFLLCLCVAVQSMIAQQVYCSKYKIVTEANRLAIDDLRSDSVDIVHTHLELDMTDVGNQMLSSVATIDFKSKQAGLDYIRLDLEGLDVDSVQGEGVLGYNQAASYVKVDLDPLQANEQTSVLIYYSGTPMQDASGWGGFYFSGNFSWNLGVGFADDPHSYGRVWHPCFDNFIEKSTYSFDVTTMNDRVAACNGLYTGVVENQDSTVTHKWSLDQPISSYLANVSVAPYISVDGEIAALNGPLPYQIFGRKSDSSNIVSSFLNLEKAVLKFEEAYGPYRFDKVGYNLVPFNSGAMEHAANITYPIYAVNGSLAQEELMAHELAHMWWGDNVTCQTDGDMWLNEGWASFSEYLFLEDVYSRERYEEAMKADLIEMLQFGHHREEMYRPVSGQPHEYVYGDHVYKKGALVAHNLRGYMGDEDFFDAIHQFMEQFKYSAVSSDSLEKWFQIYSSQDLSSFFRDWVYAPGYSVVLLDSFKTNELAQGYSIDLFLKQKLKGRAEYHEDVPVYYSIHGINGAKESGKVIMDGQYATVTIESSFEPVYIELYEHNELAQARTVDKVVIKETGNLNLVNMKWDVEVESVNDSSTIWFEHIWSAPDFQKDWDSKPYRLSNYHYWKVSGLELDNVTMSGRFFYDGREGGNTGYMDMDLVSIHEDSLVLLYRESTGADWAEYEHYEKNILGASDNGFGLIELTKIIPGEYSLANVDHSILKANTFASNTRLLVFPNPAAEIITVECSAITAKDSLKFELYDVNGKLVLNQTLTNNINRLDIRTLTSGVYHYTAKSSEDGWSGSIVIK